MAQWDKYSWNSSDGKRRFQEFKREYSDVKFKFNGVVIDPNKFETFEDIKSYLGISNRYKNAQSANINIVFNSNILELKDLPRTLIRASGNKAVKMEVLVAAAALMQFESFDEFHSHLLDPRKMNDLLGRMEGVTKEDLDEIVATVEDDISYADDFIKVGINIHKITHMSEPSKYRMMPRTTWTAIKGHAASLMSTDEKFKGDKWNPADIILIRNGFKLRDLTQSHNLAELNGEFNGYVDKSLLIPISIKKNTKAIRGSRGIAKEENAEINITKISDILKKGEIYKNVPILINYSKNNVKLNAGTRKKALGWLVANTKEHVERTAAIAMGSIPMSSVWYEVDNENIKEVKLESKYIPKLESVVVSMTSESVWLKFKDSEFLTCRLKGSHNLQLSVEEPRKKSQTFTYNELLKRKDLSSIHKEFLNEHFNKSNSKLYDIVNRTNNRFEIQSRGI